MKVPDQDAYRPLADRMRPATLAEFIGQETHSSARASPCGPPSRPASSIPWWFWGAPGTGKTTLARIIAASCQAQFLSLSAVLGGVKDIREAVAQARQHREAAQGRGTVLFVDEAHRFNKAQQDAFLPHVESGLVTFIGATTENPSFELNNALLSRLRVYVLKPLPIAALKTALRNSLEDRERGLGGKALEAEDELLELIANAADGDARRALNLLEIAADLTAEGRLEEALVKEVIGGAGYRRFDKGGDAFYDQISALHKSLRGSAPDAALYWFARLMDGGCDPLYVARRVTRMASEDIGNADPRGLRLALDAWETQERLGSPEGELALAQAILFLACAPKSNAVYKAHNAAMEDVKASHSAPVPLHLRNAPTALMKQLGHSKDYRYAHDEPEGYAPNERYFPDGTPERRYYHPADRGLEIKIAEKLARLRALDEKARE